MADWVIPSHLRSLELTREQLDAAKVIAETLKRTQPVTLPSVKPAYDPRTAYERLGGVMAPGSTKPDYRIPPVLKRGLLGDFKP